MDLNTCSIFRRDLAYIQPMFSPLIAQMVKTCAL